MEMGVVGSGKGKGAAVSWKQQATGKTMDIGGHQKDCQLVDWVSRRYAGSLCCRYKCSYSEQQGIS